MIQSNFTYEEKSQILWLPIDCQTVVPYLLSDPRRSACGGFGDGYKEGGV